MPAKYWCELCKVFVVDTRLGRKEHEASMKHKYARERQINELQRNARIKEKESHQISKIISGIDRDLGIKSTKATTSRKTTAYKPPGTVTSVSQEPQPVGEPVVGAGVAGEWVTIEESTSTSTSSIITTKEQPVESIDKDQEERDSKPRVSSHSTTASGHKRMTFNHPEDNWRISKKSYKPPVDLDKLEQLVANEIKTEETTKSKPSLFKKRKKGMSSK
ncbi:hypothetical protein TRVA0_069S00628 [Trichomonascus vanleenenianus]|uniref:uncharacterized protein n=1 Tax=Trichomonascus vanleenenianus TaxID=2268995 RepID=UPI003ECA5737